MGENYMPLPPFLKLGWAHSHLVQGFYASPADIEMDILKNTSESQMRINNWYHQGQILGRIMEA
jgi:hypothetical protein